MIGLNKEAALVAPPLAGKRAYLGADICPIIGVIPLCLGLLGQKIPDLRRVLDSAGMSISDVMFPHVFGGVGDNKILNAVVVPNPVYVVDDLMRQELSTDFPLHHKAMLKDYGPADGSANVAVASLPRNTVLGSTKDGVPISPHAPIVFSAQATSDTHVIALSLRAFVFHLNILLKRFT